MTRHRRFLDRPHMSSSSECRAALPAEMRHRRRVVRHVALVVGAALLVGGLVVTQVVMAAPPTASISGPATATRGQSVSFTSSVSDPDAGQTFTYAWAFGDGSTSTVQNPSHTYSGIVPGARTVTLSVTDSGGETSAPITHSVNVVNLPPLAVMSYAAQPEAAGPCGPPGQNSQVPLVDQQVGFAGNRSSDPDNPFDTNVGEVIKSYAWDLDGNAAFNDATGPGAVRAFPTAGNKTVGLRVTDTDNATGDESVSFRVNTVPVASFISDDPTPIVDQQITFTSTSSDADFSVPGVSEHLGFRWDLDNDGQFDDSTSANPTYFFATTGMKTVRLCVRDTGGIARMAIKQLLIQNTVPVAVRTLDVNAPPHASFRVVPASVRVGEEVTLASSSADPDGPLIKQEWDLDSDGQFDDANGVVITARFKRKGTHTLRLRVTDSGGATAVATHPLKVRSRPLKLFTGVFVGIKGRLSGVYTDVRRLFVRAPRGAAVSVHCRGKSCPKRAVKRATGLKKLRFKSVERKFRPGTKLVVTVTESGFLTKQTSFTIRRGREPLRRDLCLRPGAQTAKRCPSG